MATRALSSPRNFSGSNTSVGDNSSVESSSPVATSNRRREIEMKKELKKMEDEANYTFVPKSVTKKKIASKDAD